jgi:hypothetical protein
MIVLSAEPLPVNFAHTLAPVPGFRQRFDRASSTARLSPGAVLEAGSTYTSVTVATGRHPRSRSGLTNDPRHLAADVDGRCGCIT